MVEPRRRSPFLPKGQRMLRRALLVSGLVAGSCLAFAQPGEGRRAGEGAEERPAERGPRGAAPAAGRMGQRGAEAMEPLAFMVGEFDVASRIAMGPAGEASEGKGRMTSRWGPGRQSVLIDFESTEGRMRGFGLHQVITAVPRWGRGEAEGEQRYELAYVQSFAPGIQTMEGERTEKGLEFRSEVQRGQMTVESISVIEKTEAGFTITSYRKVGEGERQEAMKLEYVRKGAEAEE